LQAFVARAREDEAGLFSSLMNGERIRGKGHVATWEILIK